MDVNPITYEDMEVLEQEVYFVRDQWHQTDTVGMGTANLKGTQFSKFISQLCLHFVWVWMLIVRRRPVWGQKHIP